MFFVSFFGVLFFGCVIVQSFLVFYCHVMGHAKRWGKLEKKGGKKREDGSARAHFCAAPFATTGATTPSRWWKKTNIKQQLLERVNTLQYFSIGSGFDTSINFVWSHYSLSFSDLLKVLAGGMHACLQKELPCRRIWS